MKKCYDLFCKLETRITSSLLLLIMLLVFVSAIARFFQRPLNWAQDVCLIAFAWMIFLGSDIAVRNAGLIGIDLFIKYLPKSVRKILDIVFKVIIIGFLCILVYYGITMVFDGWERQITTLGISYSFVTLAVPVGSILMIISTTIRLVESIKKPIKDWGVSI